MTDQDLAILYAKKCQQHDDYLDKFIAAHKAGRYKQAQYCLDVAERLDEEAGKIRDEMEGERQDGSPALCSVSATR